MMRQLNRRPSLLNPFPVIRPAYTATKARHA